MNDRNSEERWASLGKALGGLVGEMPDLPVSPATDTEVMRGHLERTYQGFARPMAPKRIQDDVVRMLRDWQVHTTHPRYFGLFNPSVMPSSIAADALVAAANPQVCVYSHAPGPNEIERLVLRYLSGKLGCDPDVWFSGFTSGGSEANQSAVISALTRRIRGFAEEGVAASGAKPVIYISNEGHHSFEKIAVGVGLGRNAVRRIPVDASLKLDPRELESTLRRDRSQGLTPIMVVATAGTTGAGVVDPLVELADICAREELWFHVDAAWGGAACMSPRLANEITGINLADSITWDAHKWLSIPMGAGMFFCRHQQVVEEAFSVDPSYMPPSTPGIDEPYITGVQWSRRFIGLKVFMAFAEEGEEGMRSLIEHQAEMGAFLRERLQGAGWHVVNNTMLPVVCFRGPAMERGERTAASIAASVQSKGAWISAVELSGQEPALRACITSYRSGPDDIEALIDLLAEHL